MTISKMYGTAVKTIYFNEDNEHFYACHPASDMTEDGLRALVDSYAETGAVKGILFCTNLQRALFDSRVWERFRDIETTGPLPYADNLRLLSERGIDQFSVWLKRCSELGIEGWLSMRMNDSHGLKEARNNMTESRLALWPSRKWRENPQLRRAPYRSERSWEGSYNYLLPEVREHHLALAAELLERYDLFGLELDWMRWGMMFPPGFEREGQAVLTEFVKEVRRLADQAEARLGHPVRLAHRLPAHPESCLNFGYDVIAWGEAGCVDMVTLSSFLNCNSMDPPVALWRKMLPKGTAISYYAEPATVPCPRPGAVVIRDEIMLAAASAAFSCGADHIYLFNECYRESEDLPRLQHLMKAMSDPDALKREIRLFTVTYTPAVIPGESNRTVLPVPLSQEGMGYDLGRMEDNITLRLPAGKTDADTLCYLRLGFSGETPMDALEGVPVRVNTVPVERTDWPDASAFSAGRSFYTSYPFLSPEAAYSLAWKVPASLLHETFNAVEILPPHIEGKIVWADLLLLPGKTGI